MAHVTLDQLKAPVLETVDVYLARFAGCVTLQELTGQQVLNAAKWATERVGGEGMRATDTHKSKCIQVAMALKSPALGATDEECAAQVGTIQGLPAADQFLLGAVLDRLTEGTLTAAQKDALKQEQSASELLKELGGTLPVFDELDADDLEMVLAVGLRVPQVLFGQVPMQNVRLLWQQLQKERRQDAEAAGAFLVAAITGGQE